ncbi:MAG: polysaccharide deacetylase family protein [Anaerostipes sp.]|jgi:peptidoglycan-N-acetylmuramic acid deacetylase|nr:polysaccharide deacetylase family protein [Anaerostipes sp.]MDD3746018.1 polysaccharide deacetylase family protein [Anaerostipes sp.]
MKRKIISIFTIFILSFTILFGYHSHTDPHIYAKEKTANQLAKKISSKAWAKYSSSRKNWSWKYPDKNVKKFDGRYRMSSKDKSVYLTFDIGYSNSSTWKILKTLKKAKVKAIFFVTYPVAKDNPKLIKRIIADGHILGNHSTKHGDYSKYSLAQTKKDFLGIHNYVLKHYKYRMEYFRFPEGGYSNRALYFMKKMKYKTVFWDFAYNDYDDNHQPSTSYAYKFITKNIHKGSIPLLHGQSSTNAKVLNKVIKYAKGKGYTFKQFSVSSYAGIQK